MIEQLEKVVDSHEGEHCEFKEAKNNYYFETLAKYCASLANEGGGDFILGVTDKRPRRIVGTQAFNQPERKQAGLIQLKKRRSAIWRNATLITY
ncbi:putative transcriptional regulator [Dissulfuribacter thermophilus]|uniref:Putative transcriptional regulator n=2 Tax=Dissulfuribacter thermophilus TaxID=1156395 RepID=A0A1B9F4N0_9BACT|nr:putative transcriptional regulator [Dissulfuribacter thermophilus]